MKKRNWKKVGKICGNCGHRIGSLAKFCAECGWAFPVSSIPPCEDEADRQYRQERTARACTKKDHMLKVIRLHAKYCGDCGIRLAPGTD